MEQNTKIPILLVDDRQDNLLALQAVLGSPEYQLVEATSGLEALSHLENYDFAVILLDVHMPMMDGFETATRIRQNPKSSSTPIIFITASIEDQPKMYLGYEKGAVDYLFKPFDPVILKSKVSIFVELYSVKKEIMKKAEYLQIQEAKDRQSVLEYALDAVIGMNEEGIINLWNSQASEVFGWDKHEVIGQRMSDIIIPHKYRVIHEKGLEKFLHTGVGPILRKRIEVSALKKNGDEIPVELSIIPIFNKNHYQFTAFLRDISDKKRIEKERKLEQEKLQKAIRARDEFISICSHELKTPITSLKLQFQLAAKQYTKGDPKVTSGESVFKRIRMSNSQLERMSKLIDDMLDVSKISSGKLIMEKLPLDLSSLLLDVIDHFEDQLSYLGIKVKLDVGTTPHVILGDKIRIEQVITNLLTNALKYGEGKPLAISLKEEKREAVLCVSDKGLGIKKENIDLIFNRYERAIPASNISGLGLGLYITKQIVSNHGGKISVESEIGKGSTFIVRIPLLKEADYFLSPPQPTV